MPTAKTMPPRVRYTPGKSQVCNALAAGTTIVFDCDRMHAGALAHFARDRGARVRIGRLRGDRRDILIDGRRIVAIEPRAGVATTKARTK